MPEGGFIENEKWVVIQASAGLAKNQELANSLPNAEDKLVLFVKLSRERNRVKKKSFSLQAQALQIATNIPQVQMLELHCKLILRNTPRYLWETLV